MSLRKAILASVLCSVIATAAVLRAADTSGSAPAAKSSGGSLSADLQKALADSKYVYISSQRKDGSWSKPAEIWFMYHEGAVWVGTLPTSWRAKRIKANRPLAKISIGKVDGPSFEATGSIVKNGAVNEILFQTFAKKYPEGWPQYESRFRSGFQDGSRVLIKYAPK